MFQVGQPALPGRVNAGRESMALGLGTAQALEPQTGTTQVIAADADAVGQNAESHKASAMAGLGKLGFGGVELEAQGGQVGFNGQAGIGKEGAISRKQGKVIDVAQVGDAQSFGDKVIEAVEVNVGKKLTGEVANG